MAFKNIHTVLTAEHGSLSTVLGRASREVDHFDNRVKAANTGLSKWKLAAAGAAAGALAIGAGLSYAVNQAAAFEVQMRNVNSISKMSEGQLKAMGDQVLNLSRRLPQSAETLAAGLYDIASSGFQAANGGLKVLEASATAASAGLSTTSVAARGITAVLNAYGLGAEDATDVSDVLFQTVNLGVVTFEELASSIGDVVGTAAAAGVKIDQVGAALATMTLSGISGAESATSLNRLLQSLIDPSDALKAKMGELGIGLTSLSDPAIGLTGVMEKLRGASQGNVETLLAWFPEIRAARGALALMAAEGDTYARVALGITDKQARAGATAAALREQMKSLTAQFQLFKNWVNAGAIELGTKLIPTLISTIHWVQGVARDALPALKQALALAMPLFGEAGELIENVVDALGKMLEVLAPLGAALAGGAFVTITVTLTALLNVLNAMITTVANNEFAVKALAIVLGGMLVKAAYEAAAALALVKGAALGATLTDVAMKLRLVVGGFAMLAAVNGGGVMGTLKAALQGVAGSAFLAAGAFVGMALTSINAFNNAKKAGQEFAQSVEADLNMDSFDSMGQGVDQLRGRIEELRKTARDQSDVAGFVRGWADVVIPFQNMGNTVVDANRAIEGIEPTLEELEIRMAKVGIIVDDLGVRLGLSEQDILDWANKLDIDIDTTPYTEVEARIEDAVKAARNGTPSLGDLAKAFETVADDTADATDRLKAYKQAMDAVIGVHISSFDAATNWGQSLREISTSLVKNGSTLDEFTEAGQNNRETLSGAAQAALDHAEAVARETGSIAEGNATLQHHIGQLSAVMRQSGLTEAQVQDMITMMGLTPENLETLVQLNGKEQAIQGLADVQAWLNNTNGRRATVWIDIRRGIEQTADGSLQQHFPDALSGGSAGVTAPNARIPVPFIPPPPAPSVQPETGGRGGGKTDAERLDEEIARNKQRRVLDQATLQDRIKMLDGLIAKERAFTDEWMRLVEMREDTEEKIKADAEALAKFLESHFEGRVTAARNAFEETGRHGEDYLKLLHEQHEREVKENGYWSDEAAAVRAEVTRVRQAGLTEERRIEDARYQLGKVSDEQRLEQLRRRLASEKEFSEEWVQIQQEIIRIEEKVAEAIRQARQKVVDAVANVYETAKKAFLEQQDDFKKAVEAARSSVVGELSGVYEAAMRRHTEQLDEYKKEVEDRGRKIADGIVSVFGNSMSVSARAVTKYLQQQVKASKMWHAEMEKLQNRGLDDDLVQKLRGAGPQSLGLAKALNSLDPAVVNEALRELRSLGAATEDMFQDPQRSMKSFNDLLAEELTNWQRVNADRAKAAEWAKSMASYYMPVVNFQWKTFDELLQEEIVKQSEAMKLRNDALAWAGQMTNALGGTNAALREMIQLLNEANEAEAQKDKPKATTSTVNEKFPNGWMPAGSKIIGSVGNSKIAFSPGGGAWASFDSGGVLKPGMTTAYNGTGRDEYVFTREQVSSLSMPNIYLGGVHVTVGGGGDATAIKRAVERGVSDALTRVTGRLQQGVRR